MRARIFLVVMILSLVLLASCAPSAAPIEEPAAEEPAAEEPAAEESLSEKPPKSIDQLYVLEASIWESNIINICWENPEEWNQAEREFIQTEIEATWEAVSQVDFIGWAACTPESSGIRIQIRDEAPHTKGLGADLDGVKNGMVLNVTFQRWGCAVASGHQTPCVFPYNGYAREDFIRIITVHEFGHALSFAHEQKREDTPAWCDQPHGKEGTMPIGGWDLDSVMNYCNPRWGGDGHLSETDIAGVQLIYGAPTRKTSENDGGAFYELFRKLHLLE